MTDKHCPVCENPWVVCPECGNTYRHGVAANCEEPACESENTPLDCRGCGLVACYDLTGVLRNYSMELIPYD